MTHHGEALARESGDASLPEAVASGRLDRLSARARALCEYALRLTNAAQSVRQEDLRSLRDAGLDDRAIVDANQVVAYFNYVNRVAHGLGVDLEPSWSEEQGAPRRYPLAVSGGGLPDVDAGSIPWVSVDQMREVDRRMVVDVGISLEQMIENAGRALADLSRRLLGGDVRDRRVTVLAGTGGNAGGGLAAARHLHDAGAEVGVWLSGPCERLGAAALAQLRILEAFGVPMSQGEGVGGSPDLVVDAILGYGQHGPARDGAQRLVQWSEGRRVVSLDVPSGLELASGRIFESCVRAEATLTVALPKEGLRLFPEVVGDLYLADISVPQVVYRSLGIEHATPFTSGPIVRISGIPGLGRASGGSVEHRR